MAETGESEKKGGFYKVRGKPKDIGGISAQRLDRIADRHGIDIVVDGDKGTVTPERIVVVPKESGKET